MRLDNVEFSTYNQSEARGPRFSIKISVGGDEHWLTSHDDALLPGTVTTNKTTGCVRNISGTSQRLDPTTSRFEIGSISFEAVDKDGELTTLLNTKWNSDKTTAQQTVELYVGDEQLTSWDDYALFQTQIMSNIVAGRSGYLWQCNDIQRYVKKKLFEPYKTNLRADVTATATSIPVNAAVDYRIAHDATYDDAPSSTVGYIEIDGEKIRYTGVDTTPGANLYTGCTRGVLGTVAKEHKIDTDADTAATNQPEVKEVIYFMGAAPKILKKLLIGSHSTETFPAHWHCEIDSSFVATSQFDNIGADWWDTSDDSGVFVRFESPKAQDGKKFIEKEILLPIGAFMPVGADGQLGLRRMTGVLSSSPTVKTLDSSNIVSFSDITYDEKAVRNNFVIEWNWDANSETFTRRTVLADTDSIIKFGSSRAQVLRFQGIHGSRTTEETLIALLDAMRDRTAGYPLRMSLEVLPGCNVLEPGDVVRVQLPQVQDHTNSTKALDSAFEVQRVSVDWVKGTVNLDLYGSSFPAAARSAVGDSTKLDATWYASKGTELGSVLTIDGFGNIATGQTLNGGTTMGGGIFYYDGDLTLQSGSTLTINDNVQIRARGFVTIDGTIDGVGNGNAGGSAGTTFAGTQGVAGFVGQTKSDGGVRVDFHSKTFGTNTVHLEAKQVQETKGQNPTGKIPVLDLKWDGETLLGVEGDMRPTSGGGGGSGQYESATHVNGGAGGAGGAALVILSQGFSMGGSGSIDLSGSAGLAGSEVLGTGIGGADLRVWAGSGASGCGGPFYAIVDGSTSTVGSINLTSQRPQPAATYTQRVDSSYPEIRLETSDPWSSVGPYYAYAPAEDNSLNNQRIQYIPPKVDAQADVPTSTDDVSAVTAARQAFSNSDTTLTCNIEISVTEPTSGNYSHAVAYFRINGSGDPFERIGVIPNGGEISQIVAADGQTYEIQARSVSISGIESPSGPTTTITVFDFINPTQPVEQGDSSDIADQIPVPDVTGLEIFGQGNDQEFAGRDCKIRWNQVAGVSSIAFGSEPDGLGAGAGSEDYYFSFYVVAVYDDDTDTLLRTEVTKENVYVYSWEKNREDYLQENNTAGAYRNIRFEVVVRTLDNRESAKVAKLPVSNPKPAIMGATLEGWFQRIKFKASPSADTDFQGIRIWASTTQGFTPGDSTLVADTENIEVDINGLLSGTVYYVRFSPYDAYGPDDTNLSTELSVTTQASLSTAVTGGFVDKVAIGGAFVATGSVAYADIDPGDTVTIPNGTWRLDMGPVADGGTTYVLRFHDGNGNKTFSIDADGNGEYGGALLANEFKTATSGHRIEINPSGDNEAHFYGDIADGLGTIAELATIGIDTSGGDPTIALFGRSNYEGIAVEAISNTSSYPTIKITNSGGTGLQVVTTSSTQNGITASSTAHNGIGASSNSGTNVDAGVLGQGTSSACGVIGISGGEYALRGREGSVNIKGQLLLDAHSTTATPTHTAAAGTFFVGSGGGLYYNKTGGSTWITLA